VLRSGLMSALLIGLYAACETIANVTAGKPAIGGSIIVRAAALCAFSFTAIDRITERLGKRGARRASATAFVANLLLVGYVQSSGV